MMNFIGWTLDISSKAPGWVFVMSGVLVIVLFFSWIMLLGELINHGHTFKGLFVFILPFVLGYYRAYNIWKGKS